MMSDLFGHDIDISSKRYHKTDWSAEKKSFEAGVAVFLKKIECANKRPLDEYVGIEKKDRVQPVDDDDVAFDTAIKSEENPKNVQDSSIGTVELSDVGISNSDFPTGASEPKEPVMQDEDIFASSGGDPLRDVFDNALSDTVSATEEKSQAADILNWDDDFPAEISSETPAKKQTAPTPSENKSTPKSIENPVKSQDAPLDLNSDSDSDDFEDEHVKGKDHKYDAMQGFDREGFKDAFAIADRMLSKVDRNVNLQALANQLDEYDVNLSLERAREDIEVLNTGMVQVQAAIDSLSGILKKLVPLAIAYEDAWKYLEDVGILYANGSNREKREAQVKLILADLWINYTEASRLRFSYENRMRELKGQWETLSRLMTFDQYRTQYYKTVHRGERPFNSANNDSALREAMDSSDLPLDPSPPKSAKVEAPKSKPTPKQEPDIFEQKQGDPLTPDAFKDLDEFPANAASIANKPKVAKGFAEWDF